LFYYLFKKFKTNGHPFVRPRLSANQELRKVFLPILLLIFLYLTNLYLPVIFQFRLRQGWQTFLEEAICILFVLRKKTIP
jgi:hypothetical protein